MTVQLRISAAKSPSTVYIVILTSRRTLADDACNSEAPCLGVVPFRAVSSASLSKSIVRVIHDFSEETNEKLLHAAEATCLYGERR